MKLYEYKYVFLGQERQNLLLLEHVLHELDHLSHFDVSELPNYPIGHDASHVVGFPAIFRNVDPPQAILCYLFNKFIGNIFLKIYM